MYRIVISFPEGVSFYFDSRNPTGLVERTNLATQFTTRDEADRHCGYLKGAFGNGTPRVEAAPDPLPEGFTTVSKETFFKFLAQDKRDIMPTTEHPTHTLWRSQVSGAPIGFTAPGWRNPGEHENVYALRSADFYEWDLREHMSKPNEPGYYRANND